MCSVNIGRSVNISDFGLRDGAMIDWKAYYAAQVANGERCSHCDGYIGGGGNGAPVRCFDCQHLTGAASCRHDVLIRCPRCRHNWRPTRQVEPLNGPQKFDCPECEHCFDVDVEVRFRFGSPKLDAELAAPLRG